MSRKGTDRAPIVERKVLDRLLVGLADGKYHLVLGAGASFGVRNASGELPGSQDLTTLLLSEVENQPRRGEQVTLQRAFARAEAARGSASIQALLRLRYSGCAPLQWHMQCAEIPWQAIWTLNIDDALEYAYENNTRRLQRLIVKSWRDTPYPLGGISESTPIVHLHGYVGDIDKRTDPQLIFSLTQYLSALREADLSNWQTRFRGEYQTSPVIIIGARLHDELDLAGVIQSGNASSEFGLPSLIVRPNMSEFDREEYEDWGLIPVDATAEEFVSLLADSMRSRREEARSGRAYHNRFTRATFLELSAQKKEFQRSPGHDFYGGHAPEWADILERLDAIPQWIAQVVDELMSPESCPTVQRLYYLSGSPFSGKSTALLRLGRELMRHGWRPVYIQGREKLDIAETLAYLSDRPNTVLIADDLRVDVTEIAQLLVQAEATNQRLIVIGADRRTLTDHVRRVISRKYLVGVNPSVFVEPTSAFWSQIVTKRSRAGRLGILEGKSRPAITLHFVQHNADLYSSLASLEDAAGFIDRGIAVIGTIDERLRSAFATIGLFAAVGMPAPVSTVSAASDVSIGRIMESCRPNGQLYEWLVLEEGVSGMVRMRHGYLGELLLHDEARARHSIDLGDLAQSTLLALADRVGAESMYRKDYYYRAASQLMDVAFVRRVVGKDAVDDWYEPLANVYGWNARFWEQRALGLPDELAKAVSYARRAVSKHRDAFSLNTLGTILMRRAAHATTPDSRRRSYWAEGNEVLTEARVDGRGRFELPFLTFFGQTIRVREAAPHFTSDWNDEMRAAVRVWIAEGVSAGLESDPDLEALIRQFPPNWTGSAVGRKPARHARQRS